MGQNREHQDLLGDTMVKMIESKDEFTSLISGPKAVLIDFTATWCGPCKMIAPFFEDLSKKFENVVFAKVDVDELDDVAAQAGIEAMPTFQVYKDGAKVDEMTGAVKEKLEALAAKYNS